MLSLSYNKESKTWRFWCRYEDRQIPKMAGFYWDSSRKCWATDKPYVAERLALYADESAQQSFTEWRQRKNLSVKVSHATESVLGLDIPCPPDRQYRGYQRAGIEIMLSRKRNLLGDEMGLGKTIQIIGVINASPDINKILIICPNSLKLNWCNELRDWLTRQIYYGTADAKFYPSTQCVVIHYDVLHKYPQLIQTDWDLIAIDESHYIKSWGTRRTKVVKDILRNNTNAKWILSTGTAVMNRPREFWTTYSFLTGDKNYKAFSSEYMGPDGQGATNLDRLQRICRESFMIRRLKKDVLTELPDKIRQILEFDSNHREPPLAIDVSSSENLQKSIARLTLSHESALPQYRQMIGKKKIPFVQELVESLIDQGQKVILFAHHLAVIDEYFQWARQKGYNPQKLIGETSVSDRQTAVDIFQTDSRCKLFIGGIRAAAWGITLTASPNVVFGEIDYTPAVVTQAEDRAHRIGQKRQVNVYYPILKNSIDGQIVRALASKQGILDQLLSTSEDYENTIYKAATNV